MPAITSPFPQFFDRDGTPLDGGAVWVGGANLNPETSAGSAYWDDALTQPVALPLSTLNGYICRAGTPALVYTSGDYSLMVRDRQGRQVYYAPNSAKFELSALVAGLRSDLASNAAGKGASIVGIQDAAGRYTSTTVEGALAESAEWHGSRINFLDYVTSSAVRASILDGTCSTNLNAEFAAFRAALVADGGERAGYFPAGVYPYSTAPNWAIDRLTIISDGARLRYTGTGSAFVCDGTAGTAVTNVPQYCYSVHWLGRTYIEAPATAGAGMFVKSAHHCFFESFNVRGCGAGYPALNVKFAVCSSWPNFVVSGNEGGWYTGARPGSGILLEAFSIGADPGQVSYCMFHNPVIEGVPTGAYLTGTLGNNFVAGTIEGCSGFGVLAAAGAQQDKFIGVDLEANTLGDFSIAGWGLNIIDCDTLTLIAMLSGAYENTVRGGRHVRIDMQAGSHHNRVRDCAYDRLTSGGGVSDLGTYNSFTGIKRPSTPFIGRPLSNVAITVTASPMTISNQTGDTQYYTVTGGTVTSIFRGRFGGGSGVGHYSGCEYALESGEDLVVSYSSTPTITAWK